MKIGMRTPNIKKSVKARTTGKINRKIKKATTPMYGKHGMIKNPKKSLYNKFYYRFTFSIFKPHTWLNLIIYPFYLTIKFALLVLDLVFVSWFKFVINFWKNKL